MHSIRSQHASDRRIHLTRATLAPSEAEIAIRAACQRARDARAKRERQRRTEFRRALLRLWLPLWAIAAVATGCAVVGL